MKDLLDGFMNPPEELNREEKIKQIEGIGCGLRDLRKKSGYSAREVCEVLQSDYGMEIQENTLVTYESERRIPNVKLFLALCDIYKCVDIMEYFHVAESSKTSISLENYDEKGIAAVLKQFYGEEGVKNIIKCLLDNMKFV